MKWVLPAMTGATLAAALGSYLVGRRVIDTQVVDYAIHWAKRPDSYPEGVLHYVALGDSAAQGVGATHVGAGYVPLVAARLAEATGREVAVTNLSVSGAVSDDVVAHQLSQLAELPFTPDVVTLDIGGNDLVFPGYNLESYSASMRAIVEALPVGSFIADVPFFMVPVLDRQSREMASAGAELIVEAGHHLVALQEASRAVGALSYLRLTSPDLFHPGDQGYVQWADTFWAAIVDSRVIEELKRSEVAKAAPAVL